MIKRFHLPSLLKPKKSSRGFTLLLAALAASIALSLATSIFTIASKQVQISSIGRDSQYAFYSADTAAECALYWDQRFDYFGLVAPPSVILPQPQCYGQTLTAPNGTDLNLQRPAPGPSPYPYTMTFQIQLNGYCTNVSVEKCDGPIAADGTCTHAPPGIRTVVHANGFNTTCNSYSTSQAALERSVELNY